MQLSEQQKHQILTQATLRAMNNDKSLVVDMFDLQEGMWKELPNNPYNASYAKPWLLEYFGGSKQSEALGGAKLVGSGLALASPLSRGGVMGETIAFIGDGVMLYRDRLAHERVELGRKLWNEDYNLVSSMVEKNWAIENSLVDIVSNSKVSSEMRDSAKAALERLVKWRTDNDLPTQSTPLPQLLLSGGSVDDKIKQAASAAADIHDDKLDVEKYNDTFLKELSKIGASVDQVNDLLTPLVEKFKKQAEAELAAQNRAELDRQIGEVVATGQILGLVIGLRDPKAGTAVRTAFEQGAVLYKSIQAIQAVGAGFQIASLATGIGAAFAIAGALSALDGGGGGPSPTEAILNAIKSVLDGLSKIGEKIDNLSEDVRIFSARADVSFASINNGIARISDQISDTTYTMNAIKLEDIEADLFKAVRDFRSTGASDEALDLLKQAYKMAIFDASRDSQTNELASSDELAKLVWSLSDNNRTFVDWAITGSTLTGGPALLATALERYPTMLARTTKWLFESDKTRRLKFKDSLDVSSGLEDQLSIQTLSVRRAVSPYIATSALHAALTVTTHCLLRPDLGSIFSIGAELQPNEMLRDIVRVVQWPYRVVSALADCDVRQQATRAYFDAMQELVDWMMKERIKFSNLLPKWSSFERYCALSGVTRANNSRYKLSIDSSMLLSSIDAFGNFTFDQALSSENMISAIIALQMMAASGVKLSLRSIRAWVDEPLANQPEWFGNGVFYENFSIDAEFKSGVTKPVLYINYSDRGDYKYFNESYVDKVRYIFASGAHDDGGYWWIAYKAGRGRRTEEFWEHHAPSDDAINWSPFSDLGYEMINGWLKKIIDGESPSDPGVDFGELFWNLDNSVADAWLCVGYDGLIDMAREVFFEAYSNDIAESAVSKATLPNALIEACSRAWLNMVTVELASVESGDSRIQSLFKCVQSTPPIVRGDSLILSAVLGDSIIQKSLWGINLKNFIDFWQRYQNKELEIAVITKNEFESCVKNFDAYDAIEKKYAGSHQAYVCAETLRIHIKSFNFSDIPQTPADGPATCLSLTHRAIAASNSFSLLSKQLNGWE